MQGVTDGGQPKNGINYTIASSTSRGPPPNSYYTASIKRDETMLTINEQVKVPREQGRQ